MSSVNSVKTARGALRRRDCAFVAKLRWGKMSDQVTGPLPWRHAECTDCEQPR
jgi:hypothetical protein